MDWSSAITLQIEKLNAVPLNQALYRRLYSLLDLTSLNDSDTEASIASFCENATSLLGSVAGVCVYPPFVRLVAAQFAGTKVKAVTVANFPDGNHSIDDVLVQIGRAIADGAQEIDVVFPYEHYLAGEQKYTEEFVSSCKAACGEAAILKVILETGILQDPAIIADAAFAALTSGADFIKTSTGKVSEGASLEAVATMLLVIKHLLPTLMRPLGCKVSGGIRHVEQASQYVLLADQILGREYITPATFRLGASKLGAELISFAE